VHAYSQALRSALGLPLPILILLGVISSEWMISVLLGRPRCVVRDPLLHVASNQAMLPKA